MVVVVVVWIIGWADIFHLVDATAFVATFIRTVTRHLSKAC